MPATASPARAWGAVAVLGAVCGARTFTAPGMGALLGRYGRGRVRQALLLAAGGELVGDKLPAIPPRTSPPALLGRVLSGAVMAGADRRPASTRPGWVLAAGVGATTAGLSAFATQRLRAAVGESSGLPDPVLGAAEDVFALAVAALVMRGGPASPRGAPAGDGG